MTETKTNFTKEQLEILSTLDGKERAELEKLYAKMNDYADRAKEKLQKVKEREHKEMCEGVETFAGLYREKFGKVFTKKTAEELIAFMVEKGFGKEEPKKTFPTFASASVNEV